MNAIVVIGEGGDVARAVARYRALVPSAVWMRGLSTPRDPKDPNSRSLDALLEPFMQPYFETQARRELATLRTRAAEAPPLRLDIAAALNDTAQDVLAGAMALVEMLDRAHALVPVELVMTDDGSPAARTAVAWAHARSLPSMVIPDQTRLGRTAAGPGSTVIAGVWARRAAAALPNRPNDVMVAVGASEADRSAARTLRAKAREAFLHGLGWTPDDVVVVFEPVDGRRDSALDPADGCEASLRCAFDAYAVARAEVPSLRLVVLAPPRADVFAVAQRCAADAGLSGTDFAYTIADHDVWFAGADIALSTESWRSVEAAAAGIPAINLWRPANWLRGPAFSAEDGVLDVAPPMLAATLIALATNATLRTQIAEIASASIGTEVPAGPRAVGALVGEAQRLRRPAAPRGGKKPLDIVVVGPDYRHDSAGARSLHRLCHFINLNGGQASMYPCTILNPAWNAPRRDTEFTDDTVVIHAESTEKWFQRGRFVRWVLNVPGLLAGPARFDPDEMVFYWRGLREAAQNATDEVLTEERELTLSTIEPELFFYDRSQPRLYDCVYIGKGEDAYAQCRPPETRDAFVITRGESAWPASRAETAALLRGCRRLYSYDLHTAIAEEAVLCGAEVYYVHPSGELERDVNGPSDKAAERYFDRTPAERFVRLLEERWG